MQFPAMKFFLAVALMMVINAQVGAACTYVSCIMAGQTSSGVDNLLVQFNFAQIPSDILNRCGLIINRINSCSNTILGCPANPTKTWDQRLTDDSYMGWLMEVGEWACGTGQQANLVTLRGCTTAAIDTAMKACISGNINFTADCVNAAFRTSTCGDDTKTFVSSLLEHLVTNPYRTT